MVPSSKWERWKEAPRQQVGDVPEQLSDDVGVIKLWGRVEKLLSVESEYLSSSVLSTLSLFIKGRIWIIDKLFSISKTWW